MLCLYAAQAAGSVAQFQPKKNEAPVKVQTRRHCKLFCIVSRSFISIPILSFAPLTHARS